MTLLLFVFGLAIFLLAMRSLEQGIRLFSGDRLKHWISQSTNSSARSAISGIVVTAIMQSSSMVSLLVLAFVSAGIMPLFNGIGIVLGANLGTTMTGWIVTLIGFKTNLQAMVVPLLGIGAIATLGHFKSPRVVGVGKALFAFGLLVFGLDIMKDSVSGLTNIVDLETLTGLPQWAYLAIGIFMAAVMQSSSAVMIIALSMLSSDLIVLTDAAALVIGADLGTTSTTILGSLGESVIKKQLAFAQVFYNVLIDSLTYLLLLPVLPDALSSLGINDPMFGLVAFHSSFNLLGLFVFLPLLKYYTGLIQRLLPTRVDIRHEYFAVPVEVADVAIESLERALDHFKSDTINLSLKGLSLEGERPELYDRCDKFRRFAVDYDSFENSYERLKGFEGDLIAYASRLRNSQLNDAQTSRISEIVETARSLVYASKTLKDVRHDIVQLHALTADPLAQSLSNSHQQFMSSFYRTILPLLLGTHPQEYLSEETQSMSEHNSEHKQSADKLIANYIAASPNTVARVSTWFNLNHELHHYVRYLLNTIKPYIYDIASQPPRKLG